MEEDEANEEDASSSSSDRCAWNVCLHFRAAMCEHPPGSGCPSGPMVASGPDGASSRGFIHSTSVRTGTAISPWMPMSRTQCNAPRPLARRAHDRDSHPKPAAVARDSLARWSSAERFASLESIHPHHCARAARNRRRSSTRGRRQKAEGRRQKAEAATADSDRPGAAEGVIWQRHAKSSARAMKVAFAVLSLARSAHSPLVALSSERCVCATAPIASRRVSRGCCQATMEGRPRKPRGQPSATSSLALSSMANVEQSRSDPGTEWPAGMKRPAR